MQNCSNLYFLSTLACQLSGCLTDEELRFGPVLMQKKHPVLIDYLKKEKDTCGKIKRNLLENAGEASQGKLEEFDRKEALLDSVLGKLLEV